MAKSKNGASSKSGPACVSCGAAQDPADPARCAECGSTMFTAPDAGTSSSSDDDAQ